MRYLNNRGRNQRLFVTFHGTGGNLYSLYFLTEELDAKAGVLSFLGDKGVGVNRRYFNPLVNQELDREDFTHRRMLSGGAGYIVLVQLKPRRTERIGQRVERERRREVVTTDIDASLFDGEYIFRRLWRQAVGDIRILLVVVPPALEP